MDFTALLETMVNQQASDLFVTVGAPPSIKIEGRTTALKQPPVEARDANELIYSVLNDEQIRSFENDLELNFAINLSQVGRFRVNVFRQRGEPALVARFIKSKIPSLAALGLPDQLRQYMSEERGLILVVGGTGTGKSTTLASMIDYRARTRTGHILTIEDPVEFVHSHQKSLVNQREVGLDTHTYENALKNALREAPDVIMIGEIRDEFTMKQALAYAETGHLCLSTLHANNANQALDRILHFFPETARDQLLMDLSLNLKAIVSQRLCIGIDGKRVAAVELMTKTPFIADLIQRGRMDEIKDAMKRSKEDVCRTFDDALYRLAREGKITEQEALRLADSRNNLSLRFRLEASSAGRPEPTVKEVSANKKAPFEQYRSFRVKALKVDRERNADTETLLNTAIKYAFERKGMVYEAVNPHIEVQYVFGLKAAENLKLEKLQNEDDELTEITPDTPSHATLVVNIQDLKFNKPVWRMKASRKLTGPVAPQQEVNEDIAQLLDDYPPRA